MTLPTAVRRRAQSGFVLYDAANSAFITVVVTAVGGPFLTALADAAAGPDGRLPVLGVPLRTGSLFAGAVSLSVVLQVLLLPLLGAAADDGEGKRRLLVRGTAVGALATLLLALVPAGAPLLGLGLFVVANVALGLALLAYNAYLADVAGPPERDRVSARGFAVGYAGGGLVLAVALGLLSLPGLERGTAVRVAIALSGLVWALLGAVALRRLDAVRPAAADAALAQAGSPLRALRAAVADLRRLPLTLRYLLAFLLFNDAVQAVIALSTVVLTQELFVAEGRPADEATGFLLGLVLLIQVVAVPGALGAARLAGRVGAKRVLLGTLVVWSAVVLYAVLGLDSTRAALVMGAVIALVLGGSQSLARSLYSRMVPPGQQASFFGFYELAERGTAWVGTLVFAVVFEVTGSYRGAFGSLLVLFVAGGLLLAATDTGAAEREAQAGSSPSASGRKRSA